MAIKNLMDEKIFRVAMYILAILLLIFSGVRIYKIHYDKSIQEQINGDVVIYTKEGCRYCSMAKNLLERLSIPYDAIDLADDFELQKKLVEETGQTTVPYVFIKDEFIGGYSDLAEMSNNGKLLELAIEQTAGS